MTYFGFLALFIGIPVVILAFLHWRDEQAGRSIAPSLSSWSPAFVIAVHIVVALAYTTPWDNYLVATGVWWYDPALVTGVIIGWVPIEEYTFFVVQPILTGMWLLWLARRMDLPPMASLAVTTGRRIRLLSVTLIGIIWIGSIALLASGWRPGTYLGLELVWALPPILLQLGFGADILWHYRRLVLGALLPASIYLCIADAIAIGSGTWTIDPAQSTGLGIGVLHLEEIVFFFITNTLIVFGTTLVLARASQERAPRPVLNWMARLSAKPARAHS